MALTIKVPGWGKEEDPDHPGEFWDVEIEETKDLTCGHGAAFYIKGRYLLWGEISEINESEQRIRVTVDGQTGWLHVSEIKDTLPHNEYVLFQAGATASLAAAEFFAGRAPDQVQNFTMSDMVNGAKIYGDD